MAQFQPSFGIRPAGLKTRLKDAPGGAYLFCGPEELLKRFYLGKFVDLIEKEGMADFNLARLDFSQDVTLDDLERELSVLPVMAPHRLVLCRSLSVKDLKQEDAQRLAEMLENFPEDLILILYEEEEELPGDKRVFGKKTIALLKEKLTFCYFPLQDEATLISWSKKILARDRITAADKVIRAMIRLCDGRMVILRGELEKLACYCLAKGKTEVMEEDVALFARDSREFAAYDLCDAVLAGAMRPAETFFQNLVRQKTDPLILSAALSRLLTNCLLILEGADEKTVAELTGLKEWSYRNYSRALYGKKKEKVIQALELVAGLDRDLKNSAVDHDLLCEKTVLSVTRLLGGQA
ncbi:MAG: hypothetical protein J6Z79_04590 [Clostridia bacterium]|nr:hypothetical protein [Clostridia bacterium]